MPQPYNYMLNLPNPSRSLMESVQGGLGLAVAKSELERSRLARETQAQLNADLGSLAANPTPDAITSMMAKYPQLSEGFKRIYDTQTAEKRQADIDYTSQVYAALEAGQNDVARQLLEDRAEAQRNSGLEDDAKASETMARLINVNPETAQTIGGIYLASAMGPEDFAETFGKLQSERRTADLYPTLQKLKQAELRKAKSEADVAAVEAKYADRLQEAQLAKAKREVETGTGQEVQSSEILDDGTVVTVTRNGETHVIGPDGVELTGQERVDAVKQAQEYGADIQALRSGSRKAGEIGQVEAQKAFESIGKIQGNISNLDSAIAALDAGASTGVISSKFPNWKASTIELYNIQRQLGLDVIGAVTFGALSEGELSLALETAIPLNMNEPDLRDWLERKKAAQGKMVGYLTEQARFLSEPGRTLGDWLLRVQEKGTVPEGMAPPGTGEAAPEDFEAWWEQYGGR